MKIYHPFDDDKYYNNKLNTKIRNINTAIKLIFKNTKD